MSLLEMMFLSGIVKYLNNLYNTLSMKNYFTLLLLSIMLNACGQSCENIPNSFNSYNQATSIIKRSSFKIKESANCSNSSWIRKAKFYSCNGNIGFMILTTDRKDYTFQAVPYSVWKRFKSASSLGKFYHRNIKGRYQLQIR